MRRLASRSEGTVKTWREKGGPWQGSATASSQLAFLLGLHFLLWLNICCEVQTLLSGPWSSDRESSEHTFLQGTWGPRWLEEYLRVGAVCDRPREEVTNEYLSLCRRGHSLLIWLNMTKYGENYDFAPTIFANITITSNCSEYSAMLNHFWPPWITESFNWTSS